MLQRAASNAYSWWWASHIRTKQSKWMEQNLQDMEEKVRVILKLITEDGDSFAKRAEMYYKKRPELIGFVEESFKAYRALAERYDHISKELQNANNTIASVFPEQVQFSIEEEDEKAFRKMKKKMPTGVKPSANAPQAPKAPSKDLKSAVKLATKKLNPRKTTSFSKVVKSGLSKKEGVAEIDKIQKEILVLQTEKEFVKSSYDNRVAKYWQIEESIKGLQEKVCNLQDEFGEGKVIEDEEARRLMAATALNSCQQTLDDLQEKHDKSSEEALEEVKRIKEAKKKFRILKGDQTISEPSRNSDEEIKPSMFLKSGNKEEIQKAKEKTKEQFDSKSLKSLSVSEMAEKIDELVDKVVRFETAVSSETAMLKRLQTEADEIHSQLEILEEDKIKLIDESSELKNKLKEMEAKLEKLLGVQELNESLAKQNEELQMQVTEASRNIDSSNEMKSVKPEEEVIEANAPIHEETSSDVATLHDGVEGNHAPNTSTNKKSNAGEAAENDKVADMSENQHEIPEEKSVEESKGSQNIVARGRDVSENAGDNQGDSDVATLHDGVEGNHAPNTSTNKKSNAGEAAEEDKVADMSENQHEIPEEKSVEESKGSQNIVARGRDVSENAGDNQGDSDVSQSQSQKRNDDSSLSESVASNSVDILSQETETNEISSGPVNGLRGVNSQGQESTREEELDWKQLYLNGLQDREKVLLTEYTTTLRNYKDVKKKLNEIEQKTQDGQTETSDQLKELKISNASKDEEIKKLREKLNLMQRSFDGSAELKEFKALSNEQNSNSSGSTATKTALSAADSFKELLAYQSESDTPSPIEEKFREDIDELLEDNLDFWLKFSASFHEIQKFETEARDLQGEAAKLLEKTKSEGSSNGKYSLRSDARPLYKHLMEIQTELAVWLEKSVSLNDEQKSRFSSLCEIQDEITRTVKECAELDDFKFTSYQAAKFQGEILNMKQENNKVAEELQAGIDHVTSLQTEVEQSLTKLNEEFGLSGPIKPANPQLRHSDSRNRIPLRSFIFGVKPKKQKPSIFNIPRKYNALKL